MHAMSGFFNVLAYIDPISGVVLIQLLVAAVLGTTIRFRNYLFRMILNLWKVITGNRASVSRSMAPLARSDPATPVAEGTENGENEGALR